MNSLLEPLYQLKHHPHWQDMKPGVKVQQTSEVLHLTRVILECNNRFVILECKTAICTAMSPSKQVKSTLGWVLTDWENLFSLQLLSNLLSQIKLKFLQKYMNLTTSIILPNFFLQMHNFNCSWVPNARKAALSVELHPSFAFTLAFYHWISHGAYMLWGTLTRKEIRMWLTGKIFWSENICWLVNGIDFPLYHEQMSMTKYWAEGFFA